MVLQRCTLPSLLLILASASGKPSLRDYGLPSFQWITGNDTSEPVLQISFPDGGPDDEALLKPSNFTIGSAQPSCMYHGHLKNESNVYVALNGCPGSDSFQIVFLSSRLHGDMFKVTDGVVEKVKAGKVFGGGKVDTVMLPPPDFSDNRSMSATDRMALPYGMKMKLSLTYDRKFARKFKTGATDKLLEVVNLAQALFHWPSLTTKIDFEIVEVKMIKKKLLADKSINKASQLSSKNPNFAHSYIYFGYDPSVGTAGIAYLGTVCYSNKKYRTAVVDYFNDELTTAEILAHEIGHNLNMFHDFDPNPGDTKYDSAGNACTNIGTVMDYFQPETTMWSTCSVEKMESYYSDVFGRDGQWCMEEISSPP